MPDILRSVLFLLAAILFLLAAIQVTFSTPRNVTIGPVNFIGCGLMFVAIIWLADTAQGL